MEIREKTWNKLVRDGVPAWIEENDGVAETRILDKSEMDQLLRAKIVEEGREIEAAPDPENLLEELADLKTVMEALLELHGRTPAELLEQQQKKDQKKGRFDKRIFLISTKEKNG